MEIRLLTDFNLVWTSEGSVGAVARRSDEQVVAQFWSLSEQATVEFEIVDASMTVSDVIFVVSVLLFADFHADAYLHRPHAWTFVQRTTQKRFSVPHPPRIETVQDVLARLPVPQRVRLLVEACEIALPVWADWAATSDLTYFDGIMAMDAVPQDLAEATIAAVKQWLLDGNDGPLKRRSGAYHALHWPMLEDELVLPGNVYYSAFAACNLARCALRGGDLDLALTCMQQATAAMATDAQDVFLGESFRQAFLLRWWRQCLGVLVPKGGPG